MAKPVLRREVDLHTRFIGALQETENLTRIGPDPPKSLFCL